MLSTVIFASVFDSLSVCSGSALAILSPLVPGPVDTAPGALFDVIDSHPTTAVEFPQSPIRSSAPSIASKVPSTPQTATQFWPPRCRPSSSFPQLVTAVPAVLLVLSGRRSQPRSHRRQSQPPRYVFALVVFLVKLWTPASRSALITLDVDLNLSNVNALSIPGKSDSSTSTLDHAMFSLPPGQLAPRRPRNMHLVVQLGGPLDVFSLALDKQRVTDLPTSSVAMLFLRRLWSNYTQDTALPRPGPRRLPLPTSQSPLAEHPPRCSAQRFSDVAPVDPLYSPRQGCE
ncbi:hypothetical protein C8Q76DRAFT_797623 [Earliella scabrosa]|nr:hypothetical protein C8Q76DRAFT_797623 [Earliella scabrosa]